jgi:hypothetical protein
MKNLPSIHPGALRSFSAIAAAAFAVGLFAASLASPAQAQPLPGYGGPDRELMPRRDLRVVVDPRLGPQFRVGPNREEFAFVQGVPPGRLIDRRETLLDLLLHPAVNAFAWGLGEVANEEVAAMLGLPMHTVLYGVEPNVVVYSSVPPGYYVAETLPANAALVYSGPRGPVVLVSRVPAGAVVAYQSAPNGMVLNECVVVPPQPVVMSEPMPMPPPPAVYATSQPAATAPTTAPTVPMAAGKTSTVVYDANHNPIGVVVTDPDGKKEFVPIGQ